MATRLEDILTRARLTLADVDKERWTDAHLIALADEGQKHLATIAKALPTQIQINLVSGISTYTLPAIVPLVINVLDHLSNIIPVTTTIVPASTTLPGNLSAISRVLNDAAIPVPLPFYSRAQMDKLYGLGWEQQASSPVRAIVIDKIAKNTIQVFPTPTFDSGTPQLTLYYYRTPTTLTALSDVLETDASFDLALRYYITGMAFKDDKDTQHQVMSKTELRLFTAALLQAKVESSLDYTLTAKQYDSPYIGGI